MPQNDDSLPSAPWDREVENLVRREGLARGSARDRVILNWLKRGDIRALAGLLMDGHVPAPNVRFQFAMMLLDDADFDAAIARTRLDPDLWQLPYRLVIKSRSARRRRSLDTKKSDRLDQGVGGLVPELRYEAAIELIDQAVRATNHATRKRTVREVVPRRRRKNKKSKR
jgi:hypothetical protein